MSKSGHKRPDEDPTGMWDIWAENRDVP